MAYDGKKWSTDHLEINERIAVRDDHIRAEPLAQAAARVGHAKSSRGFRCRRAQGLRMRELSASAHHHEAIGEAVVVQPGDGARVGAVDEPHAG